MEFMKGIVVLVKVDEICNILKSLLAIGYWSDFWLGVVKLENAKHLKGK